jgi:hypothetical protein
MESYSNPNQTQINLDDSSSNYFATDASPFWMQMFLPAERALVAAYQRVEQNRRLTRTALGIKLYERQHGTWPRDLQDLEQVGLSIQDWTVPGIGSFGYRIQPEGAQVWGMNPQAPEASQQITATPPTSQEGTDRSEIWWLVDIR